MNLRIMLLATLTAGASAPAASVVVIQSTLETPYLWQYLQIDSNGYPEDRAGSKNIDVDGDGIDDLGFVHGGTQENVVLTSFETEILVRRVGGPTSVSGVAARFNEGFILGSNSVSSNYNYFSLSPYAPYYYPELLSEEVLGEDFGKYDEPLPRDVIVRGSLNPGFEDLWKGSSGFLGFRTMREDGWHYGWVYVEKDPLLTVVGGYVTAYGYETTPDKSIVAFFVPEPSSSLLTILGFCGVIWRRRRECC